ncbi:hypothetical protein D3C76_909900 [compost metagenome]
MFWIRLRRAEVLLKVVFKIEHFIRVNAAVTQLADDFNRHGAEIFPDHHAVMALALQRKDGEQIVDRIMHVGPVVGGFTVGDPPQTQDRHHVVDTQRAAVLHVGAQQLDKGLIGAGRNHVRVHRRQAPVLTQRAKNIRWRTDGGFQAVELAIAPGLCPTLGHADRQVTVQANRHIVALTLLPAGGKLGVRQPL